MHLTKDGLDNLIKQCNNGTLKENLDSVYTDQRYKKVTEKHLFKGHESPLSNFYPVAGLVMDNIRFATSEAAYVYFKARHHNYARKAEAVKRSKTGIHAKRIGDGIVTDSSWQQKKIDVMDNIIRAKLEVCPEARKLLIESRDKELVEDTPHAFWGRGTDNNGLNMLGHLWMLQRSRIGSSTYRQPPFPKRHSPVPTHRAPSRTWATRSHQPKCYRCNEPGHVEKQCRQSHNMTCYNCGSFGHKRKNCDQRLSTKLNYYSSY